MVGELRYASSFGFYCASFGLKKRLFYLNYRFTIVLHFLEKGITMGSINFNIRMDESLKERAFPIIESYGLTPAQAIKLFLNQIADTQKIPISFEHHAGQIPNATTREAMEEILDDEKNKHLKRYDSFEALLQDI